MADNAFKSGADDALLSDSDKRRIGKLRAAYASALTQSEKDSLHRQAEAIRASYGYSGGADGSQYIKTGQSSIGGYELPDAKDYSAYIAGVRIRENETAENSLKKERNSALRALAAQKEAIEPYYYNARNLAAAESAKARRSLNEYAARHGVSSGAAAQAALSESSALANELDALGKRQTQAYTEIEQTRAETVKKYAQLISQAKAKGQSALAESLYKELTRRDKAALDLALKQARLSK